MLFAESSDESSLVRLVGQTTAGDWLLLRNHNLAASNPSAELLKVGREGTADVLMDFSGDVGSCILDPASGMLYLTWVPEAEGAQNLYSIDLSDLSRSQITANKRWTTLFSQPQVVPDGRLVYTRHERNSDIWLIRFEL